jgi:hypothetical protein
MMRKSKKALDIWWCCVPRKNGRWLLDLHQDVSWEQVVAINCILGGRPITPQNNKPKAKR